MHGRLADNWRVLFAIAQCAGGEWPRKVRAAAEFLHKRAPQLSETGKLLAGIRRAFAGAEDPEAFIGTHDLLEQLKQDEAGDWGTANDRRPIDEYWLRNRLRPLIEPPRSQQENYLDEHDNRCNRRGYRLRQFTDSFLRFLPTDPRLSASSASVSEKPEKAPETSTTSPEADGEADTPFRADAEGDPLHKKPRKSAALKRSEAGEADKADAGRSLGGIFQKDGLGFASETGPDAIKNPPGTLNFRSKAYPRPQAPPARRKPNGADREPELEVAPPLGKYEPGLIDAEIRRLRAENPKRSIAWIAKQVGQPRSRVLEALEGAA